MYAVYAWNLFVWRVERIDVLVYVKNVGTWATRKVPNTDSTASFCYNENENMPRILIEGLLSDHFIKFTIKTITSFGFS
ncbi:MAG: hypothetical protein WBF33_19785 [Candidatus Nitrosopolaris sp.]|jgi:hypothetical protein